MAKKPAARKIIPSPTLPDRITVAGLGGLRNEIMDKGVRGAAKALGVVRQTRMSDEDREYMDRQARTETLSLLTGNDNDPGYYRRRAAAA